MKSLFALLLLVISPQAVFAEAGVCVGFAQSCSTLSPSSCTLQFGCSLNPVTLECGGMERQCNLFVSRVSCQMQAGCRWEAHAMQPLFGMPPEPNDALIE